MNSHYVLIAVALFILGLALSGCNIRWGERHPMEEHINRVTLEMPKADGLRGGR